MWVSFLYLRVLVYCIRLNFEECLEVIFFDLSWRAIVPKNQEMFNNYANIDSYTYLS